MSIAAPAFTASAGQQPDDPAAIEAARKFLQTVTEKYLKQGQKNKGGILTDINGTLDHNELGSLLEEFLCDAWDAGIPVRIMTGKDNSIPLSLGARFAGQEVDSQDPWRLYKPFPNANPLMRALLFDDEELICELADCIGVTAQPVFSSKAAAFLTAYTRLSAEDRQTVLAPLVAAHESRKALLPKLPGGITPSPVIS